MPRPKLIDRPRRLEVTIPESVYSKVQTELYSEIEARIPHGEMSSLLTELLKDWLRKRGVLV